MIGTILMYWAKNNTTHHKCTSRPKKIDTLGTYLYHILGKQHVSKISWITQQSEIHQNWWLMVTIKFLGIDVLFPTCQVRVVRFYVSCLVLLLLVLLLLLSSPPPLVVLLLSLSSSSSCSTATRDPQCSLSDLNHDHPRPVFPAGPQPRPSTPSVPCRTSTTTIHAQCSLPDLNHDHPRPVFPAGPQPRVSPPSVPCRTSTTTIHAQCSLPDLNREYPRQVFPAGPHVGRYAR